MFWHRKLARVLKLNDGRSLATLREAGECLISTFERRHAMARALERARDLLMTAADTGKRADIAAATDQVAASARRFAHGKYRRRDVITADTLGRHDNATGKLAIDHPARRLARARVIMGP